MYSLQQLYFLACDSDHFPLHTNFHFCGLGFSSTIVINSCVMLSELFNRHTKTCW